MNGNSTNFNSGGFKGIPQPLIQNFNAYEVLEPIKVNNSNVDLLVDIGDDSQSNESTNTSGLANRTNGESSELSLVDLFQNIYVNPHHFKTEPSERKETNIDFEDFVQKSGNKINLTSEYGSKSKKVEKTHTQLDFEELYDKKVQQMTEKYKYVSNDYAISDELPEEDFLDELLSRRPITPMDLRSQQTHNKSFDQMNVPGVNIQNVRVLKSPMLNHTSQETTPKQNVNKIQNNIMNGNVNGPYPQVYKQNITCNNVNRQPPTNFQRETNSKPSNTRLKNDLVSDFLNKMDCRNFEWNSEDASRSSRDFSIKSNIFGESSSSSSSSSIAGYKLDYLPSPTSKLNEKCLKNSQNQSPFNINIFKLINNTTDHKIMARMPVKPVIKDNKAFQKKCDVRSNLEKQNYTKGPELNEKSIVMPQILNRLSLHKDLDNNGIRKRLILDVGSKNSDNGTKGTDTGIPPLRPTVLMEDCNKERLRDFVSRQMFKNLVESGNIFH